MEIDRGILLVVLLMTISMVFIIFGHCYPQKVQSKLKAPLLFLPATSLDWWSLTHFVLYFLFGLIKPNYHLTFLLIGMSFECVEDWLASNQSTQLVNCAAESYISKLWCIRKDGDYWYAKWDDVVINVLGYTLGSSVANYTWPNGILSKSKRRRK